MSKDILFTGHFCLYGGSSGWPAKVNRLALAGLAALLKNSSLGQVDALCSWDDFLQQKDVAGPRQYSYDRESIYQFNHVDFAAMHSFLDELYAISKELGPEFGLVHAGIPLLSPIEIRWVDPFLRQRLAPINVVQKILRSEQPARVLGLGRGSMMDIVREASAQAGVDFERQQGPAAWPFDLASRTRVRIPFRSMDDTLLKWLPPEADTRAFAQPKGRPRVLFIGWLDRTVERLVAALPQLRENLDADLFCLAPRRVSLIGELQSQGVHYSDMHHWISQQEGRRLIGDARKAAARGWQEIQSLSVKRMGQRWYGLPIFPYAEPFLKQACLEGVPFSFHFVESARRAIDRCRPDLVVCFEEWELPRAVSLLCRERQIPTVAYYAISNSNYPGLIRRSQDWLAASGEVLATAFKQQFPEGQHRIVGDTLVDKALESSVPDVRSKVCAELGLAPDKPVVLLLSTYVVGVVTFKDLEEMFKRTFQGVAGVKDAQLIIKAHPLQPIEDIKKWLKMWGCRGVVVRDYNLLSLCLAADLVSVPVTTAAWQPMLARVPVVCLLRREVVEQFQDMRYDFLENKGVVHIALEADPAVVFNRLITDPVARQEQIERGVRHAEEHVGPADGKAGARLTGLLREILNKPRAGS
ncbi:MAG: hypothetical protein WCO69_03085 [Candidatus Omnitrophota bacterium]